jgi:hypothetical protein
MLGGNILTNLQLSSYGSVLKIIFAMENEFSRRSFLMKRAIALSAVAYTIL